MLLKLLLTMLLSFSLAASGYARETLYTWKDSGGTLHITDQAPPDDAEILEISPGGHEQFQDVNKQRQPSAGKTPKLNGKRRDALRKEAASLREEETAARKLATELTFEAQELRSRSAIKKVKKKYRRRARELEQEAEQALEKAETAARKAEKIEKILH
ncbi:MAG: DUF4124 domain-containing protein [Desulfobulbaceae bacterium]|nr:DUF4124 domain-containing protein [Desulfobulbaceae bacterium]